MAQSNRLVTIGGVSSAVITHDGRPVVTTRQLAAFFGCDERNITDNFGHNKSRFREGVHFVRLDGDALRAFKRGLPDEIGEPMKFAPRVILWTERGAARHAKALTTEKAWSIFEALEDCYFNRREPVAEKAPYTVGPRDAISFEQGNQLRDTLQQAADDLPAHARAQFLKVAWSKLKSHFKTGSTGYRAIPAEEFTEAMSIVQRHIVNYEAPQVEQPAIGYKTPDLNALLASVSSALAQAVPVLVELVGKPSANDPAPRRRHRRRA